MTGGEIDPTNGLGTLTLGGGLKFKAGKKSATVKALVLNTGKSVLTAKVSGKKVKFAKLKGLSYSRNGFGVNVKLKTMKLEKAGAKQLNKKTGLRQGQAETVPRREEHRQVELGKPARDGGDHPDRQRQLRRQPGTAAEAERRRNQRFGDLPDHRKQPGQLPAPDHRGHHQPDRDGRPGADRRWPAPDPETPDKVTGSGAGNRDHARQHVARPVGQNGDGRSGGQIQRQRKPQPRESGPQLDRGPDRHRCDRRSGDPHRQRQLLGGAAADLG